MSELDDFDELETNLSPDRSGSAKRIRAGRKANRQSLARAHDKPLWRRQLHAERAAEERQHDEDVLNGKKR